MTTRQLRVASPLPLATLLVLVLGCMPALALAGSWLPSTTLSPTAAVSIAGGGSLAVAANGNAYAVWSDNTSGTYQIRFACDTTGVWSPATTLTTATWAHAMQPSIAADAKGHVHVTWCDDRYGNYDIFYREWTPAGWNPEVRLTTGVKRSIAPSIAADTSAVTLVWCDDRDGNTEIYSKRRVGSTWGSDTRLTNDPYESLSPSLAEGSDRVVHLVWTDRRAGYFATYASDYTNGVWGPATVISSRSVTTFEPHVAISADNTQHVVWSDTRSGMPQLYYRSRTAGVWSLTTAVQLSANAVDHASLAGGPSNTAALAWTENLTDGTSGAYVSTRQGTAWTSPVTLASGLNGAVQTLPAIGLSSLGDQIAVWSNGNSDYLLDITTTRQPAAAPTITSVAPDSAMTGANVHLVLTGTNFLAPDSLWILTSSGVAIPANATTSANFSEIEADFGLQGAALGAAGVIVRTADGRRDTLAASFTVLPAGGWSFDTPLTTPGINSVLNAGTRSLAITDTGNLDALWIDERSLLPQVYATESAGDVFGPSVQVSTTTTFAQFATVCAASGNRIEAVWRDGGIGKTDLWWRERAGGVWGAETKITNYTTSASSYPSLASDLNGDVHLVWRLDLVGNPEIYYKKLHAGVWSADTRLTNATGVSTQPVIACGPGNKLYVAWADTRNGNYEIYFKSFDGTVWSSDQRLTVNTATTSRPSIAAGTDGTVHLVWQDLVDGNLEIYYASYKNGTWAATQRLTNDGATSETPSVAVDGLAQVHVVWEDQRDGTSQIYYTLGAGGVWSPASRVSAGSVGSLAPCIAVTGGGTVHTLWSDMRVTSANSVYYAQKRVIPVGIDDPFDALPAARLPFAAEVWPNPVRDVAQVRLRTPEAGEVTLRLYDAQGRQRGPALRQPCAAGETLLRWTPGDAALPRGRYFLRADAAWLRGGHARTTTALLYIR